MGEQKKTSLLRDNEQFPIFTTKSKHVDGTTLELCESGILRIGKNEIFLTFENLKMEKERSHQFQLLSFQWLNRILDSRDHEEGKIAFQRYWDSVLEPLISLIHHSESEPFFMAWNDHAFALRTVVLSKLYLLSDDELKQVLRKKLEESVDFLTGEQNYDSQSNHGWDQAKALLIASTILRNSSEVGMERFRNELFHAFSSDGIHVENSPHYHIHMLNNLVYSVEIFREIGVEISFLNEMVEVAKSTILYYQIVMRENGTIPLIGDSYTMPPKLNQITKNFILENKFNIHDEDFFPFPKTGYCYWKYKWGSFDVHFSLKNSHLSRYHRHDDDLSLTLNIGGVDVFIDGGLYKYEEKDEQRIYLRSPFSHSTIVLPEHNPQRKLGYEINNSSKNESKEFTAQSGIWEGNVVTRKIKMESSNRFMIQDAVEGEANGFEILFQTTCENITTEGNNVIMDFEKFSVKIDFSSSDIDNIEPDIRKSIYSPQYDQLVESTTVAFTSQTNQLTYSIILLLKEVDR